MDKANKTDPIIVIIATSGARTNLLLERSLKSVYEQANINPHQIYIVDDNPIQDNKCYSGEHYKIKKVIECLRKDVLKPKFDGFKKKKNHSNYKFDSFFHTKLIPNTRTKHFSGTGAWNSGAFKALHYSQGNFFLAFLDDDDEWNPNYLEILYKEVLEAKKKENKGKSNKIQIIAVISGLLRIEKQKKIEIQADRTTFTKDNFFIGNPGLQGSNLFIQLKTFWAIGGFDESLKSATDRDIAIRLIEYEKIKYEKSRSSKRLVFVDKILVKHYATSKNRVTVTPNNKKEGLDLFYRKYLHQFPKELQEKSLSRAKKLFNYSIASGVGEIGKHPITQKTKQTEKNIKSFNLIIGAISDNAENLTELFKSFLCLYQKDGKYLNDYRFLILENTNDEYKLRPIINYFIYKKNLKIELVNIDNLSSGRSISENRNILQKEIYEKGSNLFNTDFVSWVIDDDHLFKCDTDNKTITPNYFQTISEKSNTEIDAMFGQISDAPPLPFLNTLRTQLIDFYYHLTWFLNCNPKEKFKFNVLQRNNISRPDFYYDLSDKNFQHLEYPYYEDLPYYKDRPEQENFKVFKDFLKETALLSTGLNVFRKLTFKPEKIGAITGKSSIYRGGNTIIFNPELLKIPNYAFSKNYNRRSDFNWAIINKYIFKRELVEIVLPLKHDRNLQNTSILVNKDKLKADIEGMIFYRVLEKILSNENWGNKKNYKNELKYYKKCKKQVITKIKINNYRTQSLIYLILEILSNVKNWWFENEYRGEINYEVQQNIFALEVLKMELGKRKLQEFIKNLENDRETDNDFIDKVITEMNEIKDSNV